MTDIDVHPPPTPRLNLALSRLQGELPKVTKGNTAKIDAAEGKRGYEYKYADLADVTEAVGPLLAKHGLAFLAKPTIDPANRQDMVLLWSLRHESGEQVDGEYPLGPVRQRPQSLGSMITYARRYCLGASTGVVAEEDDDGNRAQQEHGRRESAGAAFDQSAAKSWADTALARAGSVKTDAAGAALIREAAAAVLDGKCTPDQGTHIKNRVNARLRTLREKAAPVNVEDLARAAASPEEAGSDDGQHRKLVGAVQGHMKRLGFAVDDSDRDKRMEALATLAGATDSYESTGDFDEDQLSTIAAALAKCRNRAALEKLLQAGETDD